MIQPFNQLKDALKVWEMKYANILEINNEAAFSRFWVKHQNVNQWDLLFTIIPEENLSYIAKLKTPAKNSEKIKIEQTVITKLENYPETEFWTIKEKIDSISLLPDYNVNSLVKAELPDKLITTCNKSKSFDLTHHYSTQIRGFD